jgi:hypothetical protein
MPPAEEFSSRQAEVLQQAQESLREHAIALHERRPTPNWSERTLYGIVFAGVVAWSGWMQAGHVDLERRMRAMEIANAQQGVLVEQVKQLRGDIERVGTKVDRLMERSVRYWGQETP